MCIYISSPSTDIKPRHCSIKSSIFVFATFAFLSHWFVRLARSLFLVCHRAMSCLWVCVCVYVSVCVYLYVQIRCRMTCVLARKRARAHIEGNSQTFNSASVFETEKKRWYLFPWSSISSLWGCTFNPNVSYLNVQQHPTKRMSWMRWETKVYILNWLMLSSFNG